MINEETLKFFIIKCVMNDGWPHADAVDLVDRWFEHAPRTPEASQDARTNESSGDTYGASSQDAGGPVGEPTSGPFTVAGTVLESGRSIDSVINTWQRLLKDLNVKNRHRIINRLLYSSVGVDDDGSAEEVENYIPDDWEIVELTDGSPLCDFDDRKARWHREGAYYCSFHHNEQVEADRRRERD